MSKQGNFLKQFSQQLSGLPMLMMVPVMRLAVKMGKGDQVVRRMRDRMHAPAHKMRAFKNYQPSKHDIFVCTYSKSGTNWMMQIAFQIANRGRGEFERIHDVVPWPDAPLPVGALRQAVSFFSATRPGNGASGQGTTSWIRSNSPRPRLAI